MRRLTYLATLALYLTILVSNQLKARDDGRFANSLLKPWFDRLAALLPTAPLCKTSTWTPGKGNYRVRIYGQWFVVPDDAVVNEPNRFGSAVVWPYNDRYGNTQIRCFMPGAGSSPHLSAAMSERKCYSGYSRVLNHVLLRA